MPTWINVNDRLPCEKGKYYVKVIKRKEVMELEKLEQYYGIFSISVFWLDETINNEKTIIIEKNILQKITVESKKANPLNIIMDIASGIYPCNSLSTLKEFFDLKKANEIYKK